MLKKLVIVVSGALSSLTFWTNLHSNYGSLSLVEFSQDDSLVDVGGNNSFFYSDFESFENESPFHNSKVSLTIKASTEELSLNSEVSDGYAKWDCSKNTHGDFEQWTCAGALPRETAFFSKTSLTKNIVPTKENITCSTSGTEFYFCSYQDASGIHRPFNLWLKRQDAMNEYVFDLGS